MKTRKKLNNTIWKLFSSMVYIPSSGSILSVFRNRKKLVALLIYSSFIRVRTSSIRRFSIFTGSGSKVIQAENNLGVNMDWLRIQYSITSQLSGRNDFDVTSDGTRTIKYSPLESFTLFNSHAAISSIIKLHCQN